MLRKLYDWTLSLAARKSAEWWLLFIAFVESSVFVIPAEVLFVPMGLARPDRVYRYAVLATVASVLGGVFGWFLGHYAYEYIARPMLEFYGSLAAFERLRDLASRDAVLLMLITSGLAHLPPMKVVSIVSGALSVNIWLFIASCIAARASASSSLPGCCAAMASRSATSSRSVWACSRGSARRSSSRSMWRTSSRARRASSSFSPRRGRLSSAGVLRC